MRDILVLRMITTSRKFLLERAESPADKIQWRMRRLNVKIVDADDQIGGGSAPDGIFLPGVAYSCDIR